MQVLNHSEGYEVREYEAGKKLTESFAVFKKTSGVTVWLHISSFCPELHRLEFDFQNLLICRQVGSHSGARPAV